MFCYIIFFPEHVLPSDDFFFFLFGVNCQPSVFVFILFAFEARASKVQASVFI
jgi:hypothetical protein